MRLSITSSTSSCKSRTVPFLKYKQLLSILVYIDIYKNIFVIKIDNKLFTIYFIFLFLPNSQKSGPGRPKWEPRFWRSWMLSKITTSKNVSNSINKTVLAPATTTTTKIHPLFYNQFLWKSFRLYSFRCASDIIFLDIICFFSVHFFLPQNVLMFCS